MHRGHITKILNGILSAGRRGADVELVNFHVDRNPEIPFSSVEEVTSAAKEAGVAVEELNIAQKHLDPEDRDKDEIRDYVAGVFEQSPSERE